MEAWSIPARFLSIGNAEARLGIGVVFADWSKDRRGPAAFPKGIEHDGVSVVADARIDNEDELRTRLSAAGASVGELLIRAYLAWGEEFPEMVKGDFAVALWDARARRLVAARDPFGVRVLFYRLSGERMWLASSVRQLVKVSNETLVLEDQRIVEYLLGRYSAKDGTFFRQIRELPAGHILTAEEAALTVRPYWRPPFEGSTVIKTSAEECQTEFRRLFVESVRKRLRSDSPVIIHVSGGLDSSSIAGAADLIGRAGHLPTPYIRGAAALHPGLSCDESHFIDAVTRRVQFPIDRWDGTASTSVDLDLADPSIAQPGIRGLYRGGTVGDVGIARSQGASVILTGTGGDEIGTVVGFVKDLIADHQWSRAIDELLFFPSATMRTRAGRLKQIVRQSVPPELLRWNAIARADVPAWLARDFREMAKQLAAPEVSKVSFSSHLAGGVWERLSSARLGRVVTQFQEHLFPYGLEYRFPFLDRDLVRFVLTIPYEFWPRPRPAARLHREALAELLPPEVAQRFSKAEFTPALALRIRNARSQILAILEQGPWCSEQYVDRPKASAFCRAVLAKEEIGPAADWLSLWSIVTLEAWLRKTFEYNGRSWEVS